MKLFVPACGDRIVLTQDWSFNLILERRNVNFAESLHLVTRDPSASYYEFYDRSTNKYHSIQATLRANTILECDRVYIKGFSKSAATPEDSFDSLTWKVVVNGKARMKQRFWVKLADCNKIEYMLPANYSYRSRK